MGGPAPSEAFDEALTKLRDDHLDGAPNRARDRNGWVRRRPIGVRLNAAAVASWSATSGRMWGRWTGCCGRCRRRSGRAPCSAPSRSSRSSEMPVAYRRISPTPSTGRTSRAIELLGRMLGAGERHPLQVMAILQGHYGKLATLDGRELRTEADAARPWASSPATPRKAMEQARRLGGTSIRRAIDLLAAADLDLRSRRDLDSTLVIEILVARLPPRPNLIPLCWAGRSIRGHGQVGM